MDPYLQQTILEIIPPEEYPAFCSTSSQNRTFCRDFLRRKLAGTDYERFDPILYPLIYAFLSRKDLLLIGNGPQGRSIAKQSIPIPGQQIREIYDYFVIMNSGDVYSFNRQTNSLDPVLLGSEIEEIMTDLFGLNVVYYFRSKSGKLFTQRDSNIIVITTPDPVFALAEHSHVLLTNGELFSLETSTVSRLSGLPPKVNVQEIVQVQTVSGRLDGVLYLTSSGNFFVMVGGSFYAYDTTGDLVQFQIEMKNEYQYDIYGLTRSGNLIQFKVQAKGRLIRHPVQIPSNVGPILSLPSTALGVFINFQGQSYVFAYGDWDLDIPNAQVSGLTPSRYKADSLALGKILNDYFEDSKIGKISNIQVLGQDIYQNSLISYTLNDSEEIRKSWVDLNFSPPHPRASQFEVEIEKIPPGVNVQEIFSNSARWGKFFPEGSEHQLYYLVDDYAQVTVVQLPK